jgi:putative RNA 2'-phosphotransferase
MISETENKKISKFLSFVLRHNPESIGLKLDENGWAETKDLLEKMNAKAFKVTAEMLDHIVATNNKQRFSFNETKTKIRASQGHSIDVELNLKATKPPQYLYHGTGEKYVNSILLTGLEKRNRQHVHLSKDIETAINVGQRHGKPKVFIVEAGQMGVDGFLFYLSDNGIWLIDNVPVRYLRLLEK